MKTARATPFHLGSNHWLLLAWILNIAAAAIFSARISQLVPTNHLDGAFQTASGLFRLWDGQLPGRDFFPYLGVGLLYFLYPFFVLKGATVAASVFAAWFVAALGAAGTVGFIAAMFADKKRFFVGTIAASLFLWIALLYFYELPADLLERLVPGNSLRPIRSLAPYLAAGALYCLSSRHTPTRSRVFAMAAVAGSSFAWSTDFGVPTAMFMTLFVLVYAWSTKLLSISVSLALICVSLIAAFSAVTVASGGHPLPLLHHYFVNVAQEQYWYFASWRPEHHVFRFKEIFTKATDSNIDKWLWFPLALLLFALYKKSISLGLLFLVGCSVFLGGLTASVGGHYEAGYFAAFMLWCKASFYLGLVITVSQFFLRNVSAGARTAFCNPRVALTIFLIFGIGTIFELTLEYLNSERQVQQLDTVYFPQLGGSIPRAWESHVRAAIKSQNEPSVEEYWGLWSSVSKNRGLMPADAIIHMFGDTKIKAQAIVESLPPVVIGSSVQAAGPWLSWNVSANWWFYRTLIKRYRPIQSSPTTLMWQRQPTAVEWPSVSCSVDDGPQGPSLKIAAKRAGYFEVTLHYDASRLNSRSLLMAQNNLVFANETDGYLSLNPRGKESIFPALIVDTAQNELGFRIVGPSQDFSRLHISNCSAREIAFESPQVFPRPFPTSPYHAVNVTDKDWIFGISRQGDAILLDRRIPELAQLNVGSRLRFAYPDGWVYTVIARTDLPYDKIKLAFDKKYVHGLSGYPFTFEVIAND